MFMQMEDELASVNACIGAKLGGARAMTATSGPGFALMLEAIGYAAETETPYRGHQRHARWSGNRSAHQLRSGCRIPGQIRRPW